MKPQLPGVLISCRQHSWWKLYRRSLKQCYEFRSVLALVSTSDKIPGHSGVFWAFRGISVNSSRNSKFGRYGFWDFFFLYLNFISDILTIWVAALHYHLPFLLNLHLDHNSLFLLDHLSKLFAGTKSTSKENWGVDGRACSWINRMKRETETVDNGRLWF